MRSIPGTITEHPVIAAAREAAANSTAVPDAEAAERDLRNAQIEMNVAQRNYMEARDRVRSARQRIEAMAR